MLSAICRTPARSASSERRNAARFVWHSFFLQCPGGYAILKSQKKMKRGMAMQDIGMQYHIHCKEGDVGRYVFLPGDPGRCESIAAHFDDPVHIGNLAVSLSNLNGQ